MAKPSIAITFLVVMLSMALSPDAALAGVYKCKDAKGKITYSDSPCQNSAAQLPVQGNAHYENSAAGRQAAAANRSEAEIRKTQESNSAVRTNAQERLGKCERAISQLANMPKGGSNSVAFAQQKMVVDAACGTNGMANRGHGEDAAGLTNKTGPNQGSGGQGVGSPNRDFDVQVKAKRDYQKQQIPGFITHEPTDPHERGVYKQEMNRQKNVDPNTWNR